MAKTVNKVILIGYVGDKVKMQYFEGGISICRFRLATHESYISPKTHQKIQHTNWHNIVTKNKLAENCEKYINKGDRIYIEGKLRTRYIEMEGKKNEINEIYVHELTFLNKKSS